MLAAGEPLEHPDDERKLTLYGGLAVCQAQDRRDSAGRREDVMAGKFELYEDKAGKFRFRLKASNGQVVASGEAYETKRAAQDGIEAVQRAAAGATVDDLT